MSVQSTAMPDATQPTIDPPDQMDQSPPPSRHALSEVASAIGPLAWVAFGGPNAHLALLHDRIVTKRRWTNDAGLAELFALCSILPGPSAAQTVIGLGMVRAGVWGGVLAAILWCMPAVLLITALAVVVRLLGQTVVDVDSLLIGVRPAVVALVAAAAWRMGRGLVRDGLSGTMMAVGAVGAIVWPSPLTFPLVLLAAGLCAMGLARLDPDLEHVAIPVRLPKRAGVVALVIYAALLVGLQFPVRGVPQDDGVPIGDDSSQLATNADSQSNERLSLELVECFYRNSSLIFGGGHVLLPLIQTECVDQKQWLTPEEFGNGLGVVQAQPGPLFALSAYVGGLATVTADPRASYARQIANSLLSGFAIFLPAWLLLVGVFPFWTQLRSSARMRRALVGVNACAVGLVVAAVWMLGRDYILDWRDGVLAAVCLVAMIRFRVSAPLVVVAAGVVGWAVGPGLALLMARTTG